MFKSKYVKIDVGQDVGLVISGNCYHIVGIGECAKKAAASTRAKKYREFKAISLMGVIPALVGCAIPSMKDF